VRAILVIRVCTLLQEPWGILYTLRTRLTLGLILFRSFQEYGSVKESRQSAVRVFSMGRFGESVASYLRHFFISVRHTQLHWASDIRNLTLEKEPLILASSRPLPKACEVADEVAFAQGIAFVPAILAANSLTVGPVTGPHSQTCWICWQKRRLQHSNRPVEEKLLLDYYSREDVAGPAGFLPSFPLMAAAKVADFLASPNQASSPVWQFHVYTRQITIGACLGIHDCPRCGLHRPAISRTVDILQPSVRRILND
jgi:bacteriocin biosynthesis cyclodehydratase domain-containing protein